MTTNPITHWIKSHPYWAVSGSWVMGILATMTGLGPEELVPWAAMLFLALVGVWIWHVHAWANRTLLVVIASMIGVDAKAQTPRPEPILPYVVGGCVIVGAGYATYKIAKFCQKRFPKKTNEVPMEVWGAAPPDTYAAAETHAPLGSCYEPPPLWVVSSEESAQLALVRVRLVAPGTIHVRGFNYGTNAVEDYGGWQSDLTALGLFMDEHGPSQSFSRNGVPIAAEASPIVFGADHSIDISHGLEAQTVVIERSWDLETWTDTLTARLPIGMTLELQDASVTGQLFYRVSLKD